MTPGEMLCLVTDGVTEATRVTGEFYAKAVAVKGAKERIAFLVKGLRWAMREFDTALPRIPDTSISDLFRGMRERHARSAATCEAVLGKR